MKTAISKTFKTVLIVAAVILLILTAVLYFIDAPVVEEGQTPTVAQKIILMGKEYLSEIMLTFGVTGVGVMGVLTKLIYDNAKHTFENSNVTSQEVLDLKKENRKLQENYDKVSNLLETLQKKQDIANNVLLSIFSLSDLPLSLREEIHSAMSQYNNAGVKLNIDETVSKIVEKVEEVAKVSFEETTEEDDGTTSNDPVYL